MKSTKEAQWLCEHSKALEKFSGQWVLFNTDEGIVSCAKSLKTALTKANKVKGRHTPFAFHVPTQDELGSPLPLVRHIH